MKLRISIVPLLALALIAWGCKQPTHPSYSPDGRVLAYEKGGDLYLRVAGSDKRIGREVEDDVAWSGDGQRIAFETGNSTVIYDRATKRSLAVRRAGSPYAWTPNGLFAYLQTTQSHWEGALLDPKTGAIRFRAAVPITPGDAARAGDGVLLWNSTETCYFDGRTFKMLPQLKGLDPVFQINDGNEWLVAKKHAPPHTHRHLFDLGYWKPKAGGDFERRETVDLGGDAKAVTYVIDVEGSPNGRLAVSAFRVRPKASDARRFFALIDRWDVLNHLDGQGVPKDVSDEIGKMLDRSSMSLLVFSRTPGQPWKQRYRRDVSVRSGEFMFIGISPDGEKLALTTKSGVRELGLR